ncbi:MAG: protein translocase subunit SecD [Acidobacteriota bacterium]|nr:protein translocase subunit SecD [Acidobacteriota bacterium]
MKFRWAIIGLALLYSVYMLLAPPEDGSWSLDNYKENIKLGLDLRGGIFMQLQVDLEDALDQFLEEQAGIIRGSLDGQDVKSTGSSYDFDSQTVTLAGVTSETEDNILKFVRDRYQDLWSIDKRGADIVLRLRDTARKSVEQDAINQTVYKIQNRIDELGVTEPVINRTLGSNRIVVELAGADDSRRVYKIVQEPGQLEWRLKVKGTSSAPTEQALLAQSGGQPPPGGKAFRQVDTMGNTSFMWLQDVMLTARNIANVNVTRDSSGLPAVGVVLNREGGEIMNRESKNNIDNQLAIVLDGEVISAPAIRTQLAERFVIEGNFTQQEVSDLVVKIKSGSLPAKVEILENRKIGPTLGRDAIKSGFTATVIGLIIVVIFILIYYRTAGFFAFIALVMNLVLIMGMLSGIGAVLTLPGIAGFILTIGMAVDANVLVFERIREELRTGTMPKNAVDIGYKSAFVTIMDANITTFLAAFVLWLMGQGPIKGFATILMIGIVCSIFTAVFCSRTFFLAYIQRDASMKTLSIWPVWRSNTVKT